jgi:hypothetical protein
VPIEKDLLKKFKYFFCFDANFVSFGLILVLLWSLLLQRSLLPGGIMLQGVFLIQGSMSGFACHYG